MQEAIEKTDANGKILPEMVRTAAAAVMLVLVVALLVFAMFCRRSPSFM